MTQFIKTNINVCEGITKEGIIQECMRKEPGYLYKQILNIRKRSTDSWTLSQEISGLSITHLENMSLDLAKKATILIHTLLDWTETDIEKIKSDMQAYLQAYPTILDKIRYADENELETIRLELLETATNPESIIELMTA